MKWCGIEFYSYCFFHFPYKHFKYLRSHRKKEGKEKKKKIPHYKPGHPSYLGCNFPLDQSLQY